MSYITKNQVLELLRAGWELAGPGHTTSPWMQKKLCCGGESHSVHVNSFVSLRRRGQIIALPNRPSDAFWLHRYGLPK